MSYKDPSDHHSFYEEDYWNNQFSSDQDCSEEEKEDVCLLSSLPQSDCALITNTSAASNEKLFGEPNLSPEWKAHIRVCDQVFKI